MQQTLCKIEKYSLPQTIQYLTFTTGLKHRDVAETNERNTFIHSAF